MLVNIHEKKSISYAANEHQSVILNSVRSHQVQVWFDFEIVLVLDILRLQEDPYTI